MYAAENQQQNSIEKGINKAQGYSEQYNRRKIHFNSKNFAVKILYPFRPNN